MKCRVVLVGVLVTIAGCSAQTPDSKKGQSSGYWGALVEQIPQLKLDAVSGSSKAAIQLGRYYDKFPQGEDTWGKWSLIAAENGSATGQWNYAQSLAEASMDALQAERRIYWLRRAAEQGNSEAGALARQACNALAGCAERMPDPVSTGYSHARPEEMPKLKREAMAGSSMAALRLAGYYGKHPTAGDTRDKWNLIAAENGSPIGQWNAAADLHMGATDPLSNARQIYWLRKAERNDIGMARARLEKLGVDQSKLPPLE